VSPVKNEGVKWVTDSKTREQLQVLVANLASTWNGGREILDRLIVHTGKPAPAAALASLDDGALEALFAQPEDKRRIADAFGKLARYLVSPTWFDRALEADDRLERLKLSPVAYFCAEFGLASWLPIYSGGLGVLAGDVLKEASDMGLPFVGLGLFYRRGFFHQKLDASSYQTEYFDTLSPEELGPERARDDSGNPIVVSVPVADHSVYAAVWKIQVGRVSLFLLDTDTPENECADDRETTATLYGGNAETRIRQELVLGIGGVRALHALGVSPSVFSMNEGHAAFLGLELLAEYLKTTSFTNALAKTKQKVVYTNHTVVPAGNDVFSRELASTYLGPYAEANGIDRDQLIQLASDGHDSGFSMAVLAFHMSGKANAVSELHGKVIPREWPGFSVEAVTNGVHVPTWLGSEVQDLLDRYLPDWRDDAPDWETIHSIPDSELQAAHAAQRRNMVERLSGIGGARLNPDALTLVWARRFAEYKRAFLLASDRERLVNLLSNAERPVQVIISGKAHPRDVAGKAILRDLLQGFGADSILSSRISFVQDYDLDIAHTLAAGADVWLNTPRKPLEASGTSGMKSSDNGGVQLTVTDGWAAEVDWWGVGWGIAGGDDCQDSLQLYDFLENGVVPTYYDRDSDGVSRRWATMMKNTMILTLSRYSARRMLLEYVDKLYLPLVEEQQEIREPSGR
jgi:starch phosphorylase